MNRTKEKRKKMMFMILVVAMAIGLMPPMARAALAAEHTVTTEGELNTAITSAGNGDTIRLGKDIAITSDVIIADKNIILDLNGKTLSTADTKIILTVTASLEVKDSSAGASGTLTSIGTSIFNEGTGTVTVSGGTVLATGAYGMATIENNTTGTINISGGTVSATGESSISILNFATGIVNITGGTVSATSNKGRALYNNNGGTANISGGTLYSYNCSAIDNFGTINITDGNMYMKQTSNSNPIIYNAGTANILGGTISAKGMDCIAIINNTALNISGGTVTAEGSGFAIENYGMCTVSGGTVTATNGTAIWGYTGTVQISGGVIGKVDVNVLNLSGNPTLTIYMYNLTSKKVNITGPLTGEEGSITLDGSWLTNTSGGTAVATATTADDAVVSKFFLTNLSGKSLVKNGADIVFTTTNITKNITIGTLTPVKDATITNGTNTPPTGVTNPVVTWSDDNGATWTASGSFEAGKVYKTKYVYTANNGYAFDNSIAVGDITVTGGTVESATVSTASITNDTLTITVTWPVTATTINATLQPGTSTGRIKAIITSTPTDHYAIVLTEKYALLQSLGTTVPLEAKTYVSGEDIDIFSSRIPYISFEPNIKLLIYDVDANGKIVGYFTETLQPSDINLVNPFPRGEGTQEKPYEIETADQLKCVGLFSLEENNMGDVKQNYFKLNNDIDLGVAPYNEGKGWPSIAFFGHFDGNGKTLRNLMINDTKASGSGIYGTGLFSCANTATIKNLAITNANVLGQNYVGILAGLSYDTHIENVFVTGNVTGSHYVGGLLGSELIADRTVVNCYSLANVSGSGAVGGLVGKAQSSTIKTSYAAGQVSIINPNEDMEEDSGIQFQNLHGGLVGIDCDVYHVKKRNVFLNNYYDRETTGQSDSTGATPKETVAMKEQATFVGFDFDTVWAIDSNINSGSPYLRSLVPQLEQATPTGLVGVAPTSSSSNDGKITGTTTAMEYKLSKGSTWIAVTGTTIAGLVAGNYEVRYAEKTGYKAGTAVTITVPAYIATPPISTSDPTGNTDNKIGQIVKDEQQDKSAPAINLNNSVIELGNAVFSTEELSKIEAGEDAKVVLKITNINNSVSDEDRKRIEQNLPENVTPIYIDLSLYKQIGDGTPTKITETKNKISISIEVPEELRNSDMETNRTYRIVRIHDGVVTIMEGTYDPVTHLFSFETDRFSTYALTYEDTKSATGASENPSGIVNTVTATNDFYHLCLTAKAAQTSQMLTYTKVTGADGYMIYGAPCGNSNKLVKLSDVAGDITSYNHKGLNKATYYKYKVHAYKIVNGKKTVIATSKVIHTITTGKTYANPTKIVSDTQTVILAAGTSKKVTCNIVLPDSKKMKNHTDLIRYETTNKAIATVSPSGKIKAISEGTCYIYAYAQNGVYKKIKVTIN